MFVTIYKTLLLVQKHLNGGKQLDIHSFFAGLVGGYYVFGTNNNINQQVCGKGMKYMRKVNGS